MVKPIVLLLAHMHGVKTSDGLIGKSIRYTVSERVREGGENVRGCTKTRQYSMLHNMLTRLSLLLN